MGVGGGCCFVFGGTSTGSPQWADIAALANQAAGRPLGFINLSLYILGHVNYFYHRDFHDITVGNNAVAGSTVGFSAHTGWDDATGWGTPNVANLVHDLATLGISIFQSSQGPENN